jgi:Xaa-Pro aminopeptidase
MGGIRLRMGLNETNEIRAKEERIRLFLEEEGLKAVVLKRHINFSWLTAGGLNTLGLAQDNGVTTLLVTREGKYVIANSIEAPRVKEEEQMLEKGFEVLEYPWSENAEMKLIQEIAGDSAGIGCDVSLSPFREAGSGISKLRYSLFPREIERYKWLGKHVSAAIEKVATGIQPGDTEAEIAGRVSHELWKDRVDPVAFQVAADDRAYKYRHPIPQLSAVKKHLMISVTGRRWGLVTSVTRMVHIGSPPAYLLKQYRDNVRIECEMVALTIPGKKAVEPFRKAIELYEELGYPGEWKHHHQGGAMGYVPRDYRVSFSSEEVIEENQAFCWNPSISGTKSEDGVIATTAGPVPITYPVQFPVLNLEVGNLQLVKPDMLIL